MAGLVLNGIIPFFSYLTGGFVHVGRKGWSVKCWSGAYSVIFPLGDYIFFFQGGPQHLLEPGGPQHLLEPENPLKSTDFTGPGYPPPPEYASGIDTVQI